MASDPAVEMVLVVDGDNQPVASVARARMRAEGLAHRATFIFVFGSDGRLLAQRRTDTKDLYPGLLDAAAGGVVLAGESYDESARRELAEELGVEGVELTPRFDFPFADGKNRCFGRVYTCTADGPFHLQPEEVASAELVDPADLLSGRLGEVTPDTLGALRRLLEEGL